MHQYRPTPPPVISDARLESLASSRLVQALRVLARRVALPVALRRCRVDVAGRVHLAGLPRQVVVVANHGSDLDTLLLFRHLPARLSRAMVTAAAADRFFTSWRHLVAPWLLFNVYPVDRPGAPGRHVGMTQRLLSRGHGLLVYPAGTRHRTGRFSTGPARLAITHGLPVVPVRISGTAQAWPVGARRPLPGRHRVGLVFGQALVAAPGESPRAFTDRIAAALQDDGDESC